MADLYTILQVDPEADPEVIEAAYRRLARKLHPDVNPASDATERMQEINAAYYILRDGKRRDEYDRTRTASRTVHATAPTARARTAPNEVVTPTQARRPIRSGRKRWPVIGVQLLAAIIVSGIVVAMLLSPDVTQTPTQILAPTPTTTPTSVVLVDASASRLVLQPSDAPRAYDVILQENHQWGDNDAKSWKIVFHTPRNDEYIASYVQVLASIQSAKEQFSSQANRSTKDGYQSVDLAAEVGAARYAQVALHDLLRLGDESASLIRSDGPLVHRQILWRDRNVLAMIVVDAIRDPTSEDPTSVDPYQSAWWRIGTLAKKQQGYIDS